MKYEVFASSVGASAGARNVTTDFSVSGGLSKVKTSGPGPDEKVGDERTVAPGRAGPGRGGTDGGCDTLEGENAALDDLAHVLASSRTCARTQ